MTNTNQHQIIKTSAIGETASQSNRRLTCFDHLFAGLKIALSCPTSEIGLSAVLRECISDAQIHVQPEWQDFLSACLQQVKNKRSPESDFRALESTPGLVLMRLWARPRIKLPAEFRDQITLVRCLLLQEAVGNGRRLDKRVIHQLKQLLSGKEIEQPSTIQETLTSLFNSITRIEPTTFRNLDQESRPEHTEKFEITSPITTDSVIHIDIDTATETGATEKAQVDHLPPFFWMMYQPLFARTASTSGTQTQWRSYNNKTVKRILQKLIGWLKQPETQLSAGLALLSCCTFLPPAQLHQLPICRKFTPQHPLHIGLDDGIIHFQLARLIKQPTENSERDDWSSWTSIPLPVELHHWLVKMVGGANHDLTIQDICAWPPEMTRTKIADLFSGQEWALRGIHLSYLRASYGYALLADCRDEVYASLISFNFCLSTSANFNYCQISSRRIWSICRTFFKEIGLGIPTPHIQTTPSGTRFLLSDSEVQSLVFDRLAKVHIVIKELPSRASLQQVRSVHKHVTEALLLLLVLTTGHRKIKVYSFARGRLDLVLKAALLQDKVTNEYHEWRVVPLAKHTVDWLLFYFDWIETLAYRMSRFSPKLARDIKKRCSAEYDAEQLPLFFQISDEMRIESLGSACLSPLVERLTTTVAFGRQWLDKTLRKAGIDGTAITSFMGRGLEGQELFEVHSLEVYTRWMDRLRVPIEAKLAQLNIPVPPKINGRRLPASVRKDESLTRHAAWTKHKKRLTTMVPKVANRTIVQIRCPLNSDSLFFRRMFIEIRAAHKRKPVQDPSACITLELALFCGLTAPELVQAVWVEVTQNRLHHAHGKTFVDYQTEGFGLRRAYLPASILERASLPSDMSSDWLSIEQNMAAWLDIQCTWRPLKLSALSFLCTAQTAYITFELPAVLVWYTKGALHSRIAPLAQTNKRHSPDLMQQAIAMGGRAGSLSVAELEIQTLRKALALPSEFLSSNLSQRQKIDLALIRLDALAHKQQTLSGHLAFALVGDSLSASNQPATALGYLSSISEQLVSVGFKFGILSAPSSINPQRITDEIHAQLLEVFEEEHGGRDSITALNHLCSGLGINKRYAVHQDFPPPTTYACVITTKIIQDVLESLRIQLEDQPSRLNEVQTVVYIHAVSGGRKPEIDSLRLCDIGFGERGLLSTIVFHPAAGGRKTINARRWLPILESKWLNSPVSQWYQLRQRQCGTNKYAFLFSPSKQPDQIEPPTEARKLIHKAIAEQLGTEDFDIRVFRHFLATQKIGSLIDDPKKMHLDSLEARQHLVNVQNFLGHGHISTTFRNYVHDVELAVMNWLAFTLDISHLTPTPRRSVSRINSEPPEGVPDRPVPPENHEPVPISKPLLKSLADYYVRIFSNQSREMAWRFAELHEWHVAFANDQIAALGICVDFSNSSDCIVESRHLASVVDYFKLLNINAGLLAAVGRCLSKSQSAWTIQVQADFDSLIHPLAILLEPTDVAGVLTIYPSASQQFSQSVLSNGWDAVVKVVTAKFRSPDGSHAMLRFAPKKQFSTSLARSSPDVTRAVSAALLGAIAHHNLTSSKSCK